jgi:hypothetical protein
MLSSLNFHLGNVCIIVILSMTDYGLEIYLSNSEIEKKKNLFFKKNFSLIKNMNFFKIIFYFIIGFKEDY